jgi:hypothetical protein
MTDEQNKHPHLRLAWNRKAVMTAWARAVWANRRGMQARDEQKRAERKAKRERQRE